MKNFWSAFRDIFIAILRLIMLQIVLFVTGLHHILFNRLEVSNISLALIPQRRDRERLAFVDDLKANNLDLLTSDVPIQLSGDDGFREDEDYLDDDNIIDDDDDNDDLNNGDEK